MPTPLLSPNQFLHILWSFDNLLFSLKEEQKKEAFEGDIAKKLIQLEGILKGNNGGNGFFVGDGVCMEVL